MNVRLKKYLKTARNWGCDGFQMRKSKFQAHIRSIILVLVLILFLKENFIYIYQNHVMNAFNSCSWLLNFFKIDLTQWFGHQDCHGPSASCGCLLWTVADRDNLPYQMVYSIADGLISLGGGGGSWSHAVKLQEQIEEEGDCMGHEFIC